VTPHQIFWAGVYIYVAGMTVFLLARFGVIG
jgi:hypothetical protein